MGHTKQDQSQFRLWAVLIVSGSLVAKVTLAFALNARGMFDQYDVLFDADPNIYLNRFTHTGYQSHAFVHPTVPFLIGLLVRMLSGLVTVLTNASASPSELLRTFAVLVSPLASTVQVVVFAVILKQQLRLSDRAAAFLLVIDALCFSSLVWGSTPESYAISSCAITLLLWLLLDETVISNRFRRGAWILAGLFAVGITITHAGLLAITSLGWLVAATRPKIRALGSAAALTALVTTASIAGALGAARLLGTQIKSAQTANRYGQFVHFQPVYSTLHINEAVANTFLPHELEQTPIHPARSHDTRYKMMFTLHTTIRLSKVPYYLPTLFLVLAGISGYWIAARPGVEDRSGEPGPVATETPSDAATTRRRRVLAATLLTMVAYSYGVHTFFGGEYFLYSQHWQAIIVLLVAGVRYHRGRWVDAALGAYALAVVGLSVVRLVELLHLPA